MIMEHYIKECVSKLEAKLHDHDVSMGSIVVHSLRDKRVEKRWKMHFIPSPCESSYIVVV